MEVYKDSSVDEDEFDFENILPYFKDSVARTRSKYETLMDDLSDKIQYLPKDKREKFTKFMLNIIATELVRRLPGLVDRRCFLASPRSPQLSRQYCHNVNKA